MRCSSCRSTSRLGFTSLDWRVFIDLNLPGNNVKAKERKISEDIHDIERNKDLFSLQKKLIGEEIQEKILRKILIREEIEHKRELYKLQKEEILLKIELLKTELKNTRQK